MAASIINTNLMSLNAQRHLNKNAMGLSNALERLSSGLRVNSARDDAAGLAVAMGLESDVRAYGVKMRNAGDDISDAQTKDGALSVATDILHRMYELAVQSSGTYGSQHTTEIDKEFASLGGELDTLLAEGGLTAVNYSTVGSTTTGTISGELTAVATQRATLGATVAKQEFEIQRYEVAREMKAAAESRIMDTDFAAETANLTRGQILQQAGTAMVAQANQIPTNVLGLLR
jgi:flagellin